VLVLLDSMVFFDFIRASNNFNYTNKNQPKYNHFICDYMNYHIPWATSTNFCQIVFLIFKCSFWQKKIRKLKKIENDVVEFNLFQIRMNIPYLYINRYHFVARSIDINNTHTSSAPSSIVQILSTWGGF
jgi:hypothetical protein